MDVLYKLNTFNCLHILYGKFYQFFWKKSEIPDKKSKYWGRESNTVEPWLSVPLLSVSVLSRLSHIPNFWELMAILPSFIPSIWLSGISIKLLGNLYPRNPASMWWTYYCLWMRGYLTTPMYNSNKNCFVNLWSNNLLQLIYQIE